MQYFINKIKKFTIIMLKSVAKYVILKHYNKFCAGGDFMAVRILWDKYETAILLDTCIKVCNKEISRPTAIKNVSDQLRKMATNKGIEIDEVYRNANGISLQMTMMIGLVAEKATGLTAPSKLFKDIFEIYRNDREAFDKILSEAKSMISNSSNDKDKFFEYVMNKKPKEASDIFLALDAVDKFALSSKVLVKSIYVDPSNETIKILRRKILSNKFFVVKNKKIMRFAEMGIVLLSEYVNNYQREFSDFKPNNKQQGISKEIAPQRKIEDITVGNNKDSTGFYNWMVRCAGLTDSAAKSYRSSLKLCDSYANGQGIYKGSITDCGSFDEFAEKYKVLKDNSGFKDYSNSKHRFPAASLNKYAEYMEAVQSCADKTDVTVKSVPENKVSSELSDRCNAILKAEFEDGYRINHYMHKQSFIELYEGAYGTNIFDETEDIDALLKEVGQVIDDRIFANVGKLSSNVLADIYNDIQNTFNNGVTVIYIECVFEKYNHRLSEEINVYSASTLRNVFVGDSNFPMELHVDKTTIQKYGISGGLIYEVEECLKNSHTPLSYDNLHKILWYIPIDRIKFALNHIQNAAYVDDFSYLYAPNFNIPANELSKLTTAMHNAIYSKGYLVSKDLRGIFRENCPTAAMDSEHYKDYAIREILKVLLGNKFDFTGSVISEKGTKVDMRSVFREFAAEHDILTLSQVREFADELNVSIYWYNILEKMVRISSDELINKNLVSFDVTATDKMLESFCAGNFVMLKDVSGYLSFPSCGYKWNGFVLESYLRDYSETFRLIQLSVSSDDFVGAMVKKSSGIERYEDIAAEVLAASNGWNDEKSALACLVNTGLQQRRANKKIAEIIKKAKNIIAENE